MKIHQLPSGARFEYEGTEYVKTGPMSAASAAGPRFIPKYAVLKPLGEPAPICALQPEASLPRSRVLAAFETFHAECKQRMPQEQQAALDAARSRFMQALG